MNAWGRIKKEHSTGKKSGNKEPGAEVNSHRVGNKRDLQKRGTTTRTAAFLALPSLKKKKGQEIRQNGITWEILGQGGKTAPSSTAFPPADQK